MSKILTRDITTGHEVTLTDGAGKFDLMTAYFIGGQQSRKFQVSGYFADDESQSRMTFSISVTSALPRDDRREFWELEGWAVKGCENWQCSRRYRANYYTDTRKGMFQFIK